ncbi:MAG: hypothetical protein DWQ28_06630 [Proteobacteria bacterium]|nr:MAG: hypothetical protein DWQ28_06325 [Pseudomonadota bacterium]REJ67707.1 MAG: hypothetical protein DWQ28_06630 [Pseudomonadota bacterium]
MLAEIAAANAAFSVLKQAITNGKELASAGQAIAEFVGAKEKLEKKANKNGSGSDLEAFMGLERIREQEQAIKELMIYTGRPGLWSDFQKFQAKARVQRREAEVAAAKRRKKIVEGTIIAAFVACCLAVLGALAALILHHQGRL